MILSPVIGELLSSSAPPVEFFKPEVFVFLVLLYGSGAVLIRETAYRWHGGWSTVLVLGIAFGMIEEGLVAKSFFDPGWQDLGILETYGRWYGVNWTWALLITVYHAVFSMALPIMLAGLMFPAYRSRPWISREMFWMIIVFFGGACVVGFNTISEYRPASNHFKFTVLIIHVLILTAWRLTLPQAGSGLKSPAEFRHRWFGLTGFLATLSFMVIGFGLPHTGIHPLTTIAAMIGLMFLVVKGLLKITRHGLGWTDRHKLALISGSLTFFICMTPLHEMNVDRPDNPAGMIYVGLAMLVYLIWLSRRVRRSEMSRNSK
jgi:hypothetical protein